MCGAHMSRYMPCVACVGEVIDGVTGMTRHGTPSLTRSPRTWIASGAGGLGHWHGIQFTSIACSDPATTSSIILSSYWYNHSESVSKCPNLSESATAASESLLPVCVPRIAALAQSTHVVTASERCDTRGITARALVQLRTGPRYHFRAPVSGRCMTTCQGAACCSHS